MIRKCSAIDKMSVVIVVVKSFTMNKSKKEAGIGPYLKKINVLHSNIIHGHEA